MNPNASYPVIPSHYTDETARLGFEPVYLQPPETKTFVKPKPKPIVYTPPPVRPVPVVHSPVVRKIVVEPAPAPAPAPVNMIINFIQYKLLFFSDLFRGYYLIGGETLLIYFSYLRKTLHYFGVTI